MKTYSFKVIVEPDEGGYHAYCPALRSLGAVTQGATEAEALRNINEVVRMIIDELQEDGIALPGASADDVQICEGTRVAITSHRRYQHADGRRVTVPFHGANTTFVPKTLRSILFEQARWTDDDLRRLGLVR